MRCVGSRSRTALPRPPPTAHAPCPTVPPAPRAPPPLSCDPADPDANPLCADDGVSTARLSARRTTVDSHPHPTQAAPCVAVSRSTNARTHHRQVGRNRLRWPTLVGTTAPRSKEASGGHPTTTHRVLPALHALFQMNLSHSACPNSNAPPGSGHKSAVEPGANAMAAEVSLVESTALPLPHRDVSACSKPRYSQERPSEEARAEPGQLACRWARQLRALST